jgi:cellulose synthase operon protein C
MAAGRTTAEGADDLERAMPARPSRFTRNCSTNTPCTSATTRCCTRCPALTRSLGETKEAMEVMDRLVRDFPRSRYIDEVQFRRAEYFFTHRRYLDAEEAYTSIVDIGVGSFYYELALYKLGWTFYKQELYEEALHRFIALLDHKVSVGYDFRRPKTSRNASAWKTPSASSA